MVNNLYLIRSKLTQGKKLTDLALRVTFYARVSTDRDEQLNSLDNQIMYFENYIKGQVNWTYVVGYVDEGITGTSVKKRNSFLRMIRDAKDNKFDLILTKEISRFSRNTVDSIQYTQMLLSRGIGVFFLNDNINTFDSDSELRLTIMSSIAQDEIRKLSERVKFGYKRSIERGIVPGNDNIYGYKKNNGKLEIVEEEASLIKTIFREYAKGMMGTTRLGLYLYNNCNITSKMNKPLSGTVISRIIRNPKYKGFFCAHKEETIDYHSKKKIKFKPNEWIVYRDNDSCPPIVSEYLWNKCNKILNLNTSNYKTKHRTDMRYALSGKIKCGYDGATFIRGSYKSKKTNTIIKYYGCSNYRKYGKSSENGCINSLIYYDDLFNVIEEMLRAILSDNNIINDIYNLVSLDNSLIDDKNNYDREINRINIANLKLIDMRVNGEVNSDEFEIMKKKYNDELQVIKNKKDKLKEFNLLDLEQFKSNVYEFIFNDQEMVLRIFNSILDTIFVESNHNHKTLLHFYLNVDCFDKNNFNFKEFLLLFRDN